MTITAYGDDDGRPVNIRRVRVDPPSQQISSISNASCWALR